ncbi:MAG: hypothetical protein V8R46_04165 [Eubacterium ramulus]
MCTALIYWSGGQYLTAANGMKALQPQIRVLETTDASGTKKASVQQYVWKIIKRQLEHSRHNGDMHGSRLQKTDKLSGKHTGDR